MKGKSEKIVLKNNIISLCTPISFVSSILYSKQYEYFQQGCRGCTITHPLYKKMEKECKKEIVMCPSECIIFSQEGK